jgi:hypothetical protein
MMKFFYNMNLTVEAPTTYEVDGTHVKQKLVPIIGLHALAEKYDAELLQRASADAFQRSSVNIQRTLTIDELELLVRAHYPFCTATCGDMGLAIVTFMMKKSSLLMRNIRCHALVREYGIFGGDLYIEGTCAGKLTVQ